MTTTDRIPQPQTALGLEIQRALEAQRLRQQREHRWNALLAVLILTVPALLITMCGK